MKYIPHILMLILLTSPAYAFDKWNIEEKIAQGVSIVLSIIDWGQTLDIADNPDKFYEKQNFMLSKHPSRGSVNLYFLLSIAGKTALVHVLPRDYNLWGRDIKPRRIVQGVYIGISGYNVTCNYTLGIRMGF